MEVQGLEEMRGLVDKLRLKMAGRACVDVGIARRVVSAGQLVEVYERRGFRFTTRPWRVERRAVPALTRREDSVLRAGRMVRWLVASNAVREGTHYFFTATFARPVLAYADAVAAWERFRRRLVAEFPDVSYVVVPERQKSGRWHFHAVLFSLPSVAELSERYGRRVSTVAGRGLVEAWPFRFTEMWSAANGGGRWLTAEDGDFSGRFDGLCRASVSVVRDRGRLASYVTKYLTKETAAMVPPSRRCYFAGGRGLLRPTVEELDCLSAAAADPFVPPPGYVCVFAPPASVGQDGSTCLFRRWSKVYTGDG